MYEETMEAMSIMGLTEEERMGTDPRGGSQGAAFYLEAPRAPNDSQLLLGDMMGNAGILLCFLSSPLLSSPLLSSPLSSSLLFSSLLFSSLLFSSLPTDP